MTRLFNGKGSRGIILLLACSYILFFYKLGGIALIGADEPRYASVARTMMETGDYITPQLDDAPWFEKPPLYYWIAALSFRAFGVSEFSARLGSALLALAGALVVYAFGRSVFSARAGLLAALILVTSVEYFILGRGASTDLPLAVTMTSGLAFFYMGLSDERFRFAKLLAGYALFGLAVVAKGLIGVVFPALIILIYVVMTRQYKKIYEIHLFPGILVFLAVAAPWYVLATLRHKFDFIATFFLNHHLARFFTTIHHHAEPWYYFLLILILGFFPWSSFFPAIVRRMALLKRSAVDRPQQASIFLWIWALVPFIVFSLSQSKLPGYILPVIPPLALLVSREWDEYLADDARGQSKWMRLCLHIYMLLALAGLIALPVFLHSKYRVDLGISGLVSLPFAASFVTTAYVLWKKKISEVSFLALMIAPLLLTLLTASLLFPALEDRLSAKALSLKAKELVAPDDLLLTYQFYDHNLKFYSSLKNIKTTNNTAQIIPLMAGRTTPAYCIVLTRSLGELESHPAFKVTRVYERGNKTLIRLEKSEERGAKSEE
jgi:4-amino-4-deoxy-L-arabinose transferase-like glycosyltransferase